MNITTNAAGVTTATQEFAGATAKAVALPGRDRIRLHAGWESQSDRDLPSIGHVTHNQAIALIDALKAVLDATSKQSLDEVEPSGHPHHPEGFCTIASCAHSRMLLAQSRTEDAS